MVITGDFLVATDIRSPALNLEAVKY